MFHCVKYPKLSISVQNHLSLLCTTRAVCKTWWEQNDRKKNVVSRHFTMQQLFASFSELWKSLLSEHCSVSCGHAVLPAQRWAPCCSSWDRTLPGHSSGRWATHVFWLRHFYASPSCDGVFVPAPTLGFWRHVQQEHFSAPSLQFFHLLPTSRVILSCMLSCWNPTWVNMHEEDHSGYLGLIIHPPIEDSIIKDFCLSYCVE